MATSFQMNLENGDLSRAGNSQPGRLLWPTDAALLENLPLVRLKRVEDYNPHSCRRTSEATSD